MLELGLGVITFLTSVIAAVVGIGGGGNNMVSHFARRFQEENKDGDLKCSSYVLEAIK